MPKQEAEQLSMEQLEGVLAEGQMAKDDDIEGQLQALMSGEEPAEEEPAEETAEEAASDDDAEQEAPDEEGEAEEQAAPDEEDEAEETDEAPIDPPTDWSADEHELFLKQDRKVQELITSKAKQFTAEIEKEREGFAQERQRISEIDKVIEPHLDAFKADGVSVPAGLDRLFTISAFATSQPEDFIKWFAHNRAIDLAGLTGQPAQQTQQTQIDPAFEDPSVAPLRQEIAALQQQVQQLGGTLQSREQLDQQRVAQQEQQTIDGFKNAKADDGKPLHPYFEDVRSIMASLMRDGNAADLQSAYDQAVWAHPEVRQKLEASRKAAADRESGKTRRKKAAAAKKAGSSISGTPTVPAERKPFDDPMDELNAVAEELGAQL